MKMQEVEFEVESEAESEAKNEAEFETKDEAEPEIESETENEQISFNFSQIQVCGINKVISTSSKHWKKSSLFERIR